MGAPDLLVQHAGANCHIPSPCGRWMLGTAAAPFQVGSRASRRRESWICHKGCQLAGMGSQCLSVVPHHPTGEQHVPSAHFPSPLLPPPQVLIHFFSCTTDLLWCVRHGAFADAGKCNSNPLVSFHINGPGKIMSSSDELLGPW